jgi:OTU domain-containing protein 6
MSDEEFTLEEIMLKRHRKEKKELQAKIQNLKKASSKGDKKKKKDLQEEITELENELGKRHNEELESLSKNNVVSDVRVLTERLDINEENNLVSDKDENRTQHVSKAQKRRDKKEQLEKERLTEIKAQQELNKLGPRHLETTKILEILKHRNLTLHDIPSNGDCLFAAICHQMERKEVLKLRQECVEKIRSQKMDYLPFLTHTKTGEMLTDVQFEEYCSNMADTNAWGGQIELRAISDILGRTIEVLQAEGSPVIIGDNINNEQSTIILTYHRHYLGLGEHYNSTKLIDSSVEENCD